MHAQIDLERWLDDAPAGKADSFYLSRGWLQAFADPSSTVVEACPPEDSFAMPIHEQPEGSANSVYDLRHLVAAPLGLDPTRWKAQRLIGARRGQWNTLWLTASAETQVGSAWPSALLAAALDTDAATAALWVPHEIAEAVAEHSPALQKIVLDAGSRLSVPEGDFETYLAALSASKRGLVRRERRRHEGETRVRTVQPDSDRISEYARLACNVQRRHGQPADHGALEVYIEQLASVATPLIAFESWRGKELRAMSLAYRYGDVLWMRIVGLSYDESNGTDADYGTVLIYAPVEYAQAHGLHELDLGAGVSRAKSLRGARTQALWALVKPPAGQLLDETALEHHNAAKLDALGLTAAVGV